MSQKLTYILIIILLNQFIGLSEEPFHYSEPDLKNPNIPKELRESCGYRYGVFHRTIKYSKNCFKNSYEDKVISKPIGSQTQLPATRVWAGKNVKFREAPWEVQIVKRIYHWYGSLDEISHHCTGVLITMRHILTAAHCKTDDLSVYLGSDRSRAFKYWSWDDRLKAWSSRDFTFHQHPNYGTGRTDKDGEPIYDYDYDIGIIELRTPIDWQTYGKTRSGMYLINTICLPLPENVSDPNIANNNWQKATIFGWGKVKGHTYPKFIQRGDLLVRKAISHNFGGQLMRLTSFDAQDEPRPCNGDSGSGIVQYIDGYESRAVLIAIQSQVFEKILQIKDSPCYPEHIGPLWAGRVVEYLDWINTYLNKTN